MTTPTCTVCGAAEEPGRDHTCPVCGADLPETTSTADAVTDAPEPTEAPDAVATSQPDAAPPEAPRFEGPRTTDVAGQDVEDTPPSDAPGMDVPRTEATPPPPAWPTAAGPAAPPPGGSGPTAPPAPSPYDPSHPSGLSSSVRTYGMLTHLSAFLGALVALAFVGPLVMWLIRRDEHAFLDHHGKEALNFNLSMLLYFVIGFVASIATLGLGLVVVVPAAAVFFFTWIVTTIIGAVKANAGEGYRYPLSIRFVQD